MRQRADEAVALLRSVGSTNRLMILCQLVEEERSVSQLVDALGQSQSVVSQHLAVLRREAMVVGRRDGQSIHYRIADDRVRVLMQTLFQLFCHPDDKV
ncbi:helix-turn-helix transcriptional regulator [Pigmentiphaga aceris]|uniref:Helix-turn-helix transcriptional regulator n=2 Tax=Pigmentiphaga aceris TaxID=1940612 RepID=A0A5C0B2W4_9BURK|nr:helix-turn-helix transcriptional regulator [Pigmentiphaga aceris]